MGARALKRLQRQLKEIWDLMLEVLWAFQGDEAPRLAAALAFYTIFSLAPTLLIAIAISAQVVGESAARAEALQALEHLFSSRAAEFIVTVADGVSGDFSTPWAMAIGFAAMLFGATLVFAELHYSLNRLWNIETAGGVKSYLRRRLVGFVMLLTTGIFLVLSVTASMVLSSISRFFSDLVTFPAGLWQTVDFVVSFGFTTLLFAMIYKFVPDADIGWGDVWIGSIVTSLLFTLGKILIGFYLGGSSLGSVYGAAGSFVVVLLWVYYSAQVFFFGAELTQAYARRYGSQIVPYKVLPASVAAEEPVSRTDGL